MPESRPTRILYMEDDPGLGRLFQRSLERAGYAVDLARDGEEGLALCETGRYDVLAVDYKMPVHDGLEVIRILALRGTLPPTIMLTGQGDEAIAVEAMKLGAGEYIVKDLERGYLQLLPSVIERMLHQQRLVDAERRALEALRESEERFRAVAESASDALICCDSHETIFFWSKSAETIFGYTAGEATGEPFAFLVPPRWREAFGRQLQEAASRGPDALARPVELAGIRKDGSEFPAEASFSIWHAGSEICYTGIIRDITERRRAEAMLRAAARLEATATLAGGIAHQFNNLMFAVMGNAELLQFEFAGRADVRDGLDRIVKSAQRASELAQQLLAFARGGKYQPVVMDLNDTIQEALWSKQQAFPARIGVERDVEPELWRIEADPAQMAQMVVNLCANAVEAIDGTGRVVITTRNLDIKSSFAGAPPDLKPGRYVCFSVEDTGSGMGPDVQARIFEPFFSTKFLGRGLGLAAVYGIVKNHGGHLSVFSQENQGTSFKIYLPAAEILGEASLEPGIPVERETVLVIDDDEMVLSVTQQLLERLGYDVLVAPSGPVALDIARTYEGPIHAAMLDMRMPDMSGPEVFPLLVEARPGIKVLLCSGFDVGATARALLNAGAKAFISKPFQVDALASELRKALEPE